MKNFINENKKSIIIALIFIILIIILNIVINLLNKADNKLLINYYISKLNIGDIEISDNSCDIDYTLKYNNIPYFNFSNNVYDKINNEILEEVLLRSCYQEGEITYEASLNNNILSLAINISHETVNSFAYVEYKTYNIDIDKNEKIDNITLLNKFNLNLQNVINTVLNNLQTYYFYEKNNNLIESTTTFNEYLDLLNYETITLDNMILYLDDKNDLYIFKDYTLTEGMVTDDNYPVFTIKFKLN